MKTLSLAVFISLFCFSSYSVAQELYNFEMKQTDGTSLPFSKFKGKTLLIVNIATRCGLTGQLDDIEALYKKYKEKGFEVVGIPSNDFASQTPENDSDVAKFCRLKYGATFPITTKTIVTGDKKHALYKYLVKESTKNEIEWNFTKFLFDKNGKLIKRYPSMMGPMSREIRKTIERNL
ncbi:glutathione peroxidase [Halobacteriovorax sp. GB3]|uniref:glutathione peroxidase n=1 Tax=Halobacteriovorax sp. GB3 TaxID=2719615 RepID=UPI00235F56BF|nr:glutathione peroxidase [Halobacteriovorax sp. GB3]MDD0851738.1 glutathione peroxidase [Halobacteriovorax sp. GB3]